MLFVEELLDVVDSQIIIHGNNKVFIRGVDDNSRYFSLFAGEDSADAVFECTGKHDACIEENSLVNLAERLKGFEGNEQIFCSCDEAVIKGFSVGFKSSNEGFIETFNSAELSQPTIVL